MQDMCMVCQGVSERSELAPCILSHYNVQTCVCVCVCYV